MAFVNTDWRSGMQGVSSEIDNRFGEALTVIPVETLPNRSGTPDHANAVTLTGVFAYRAKMIWPANLKNNQDDVLPVTSRDPTATFSREALPWQLKQGDWIQRCCDGTIFQITTVKPDGVSRIVCDLLQLGRASQ